MHPMAVYCELLGMRPMIRTGLSLDAPYRIRYHRHDFEKHLQWYVGVDNWQATSGGICAGYKTITWEEIPDELLDTLSIELINQLRDHP